MDDRNSDAAGSDLCLTLYLLCVAIAVAGAYLILGQCRCCAAPAPVPKPPAAHQLEGAWHMEWRGMPSSIWLARGGHFADYYRSETWLGEWSLDGNQLAVKERSSAGVEISWTATLEPARRDRPGAVGTLSGGGDFALRP